MNEKKKEKSKEIKNYLKNLMVLILSAIPLYFEFSIVEIIVRTENEKLIWLLDLGLYNAIFSIIVACFLYLYNTKKTNVEVNLYYSEDELSTVNLENQVNKKIIMKISIKGIRDNIPEKIILNYPDWLDVQIKGSNYITALDSLYQYHINLKKMINQQKEIDTTKLIPIDLIGASDEGDEVKIIPELTKVDIRKKFFIGTKVKGIMVKLKGE